MDSKDLYIAWLEEAGRALREKEAAAERCLGAADYACKYKDLMVEKAEIIKQLPLGFAMAFPDVDESARAARERIRESLAEFSQGAANALALGSTFYMSALLYPEDHQPGEPNNLERLVDDLKRK